MSRRPHRERTAFRACLFILGAWLPGASLAAEETRPRSGAPAGARQDAGAAAKSAGAAKAGAAAKPAGGAVKKPAAADEESAAEPEGGADEPFVHKLVAFIRGYAVWIIAVLAAAFAAIAGWAFLGARKGAGDGGLAELGLGEQAPSSSPQAGRRFSSTKIAAADVNRRLSGAVTTTEVETDREYALVVDEDALKMPPLPEDAAGVQKADSQAVDSFLGAKDLESAYKEYHRQVEKSAAVIFEPRVEMALGDALLRSREHEKAARVLERHVTTQREADVRPGAYFDLGYIHFMNGTMRKASRFLKLFVKVEKNPAHVERAKRILARIESASGAA